MNASCREVQERLADLAGGGLENGERPDLMDHIKGCPACARACAAERLLRAGLKNLPILECPESITRAVLEKTRRNRERLPVFGPVWKNVQTVLAHRNLKPALAFALILGASLLLFDRPRRMNPSETCSAEDIARAREIMKWGIVYSAGRMQESEQRVFHDVVNVRAPETIERSVLAVYETSMGETP